MKPSIAPEHGLHQILLRAARVCGCILFLACQNAHAQVAKDRSPLSNLSLPGEAFEVAGRPAFVMLPEDNLRRSPQPWIMYAPTLPCCPDRHEEWMHSQSLQAGIAVAGVDIGEAYGSPKGQAVFDALYETLLARGFAKQPCLLGRSRGGLWVTSWAARNVDKVAGIAGIYPVFDLRSYPGVAKAAPAYDMTAEALEQHLKELNPIESARALADAAVPVRIIHGDSDRVVPLEPNTMTLFNHYREAGHAGHIDVIVVPGQGHNFWTGFFRCKELVDFAIAQAFEGAGVPRNARPKSVRNAPNLSNTITTCELEYTQTQHGDLTLDLYRPQSALQPLPVVVWIHGGGWKNGSKQNCPAAWLAEHGFAVASIDYRLTDQAGWPAQIDDCRAAVRWLRTNAPDWNLDPNRIAVWGSSAGGHLAALVGTLDAPEQETVSSKVQAAIDWFGPSDLLTMPPNVVSEERTLEQVANSNGAKLLGGTVRDLPDLAKQASAFYQASKSDPPFLIMHGDADPGVPLEQSQKLHQALKKAGVDSTLTIIEGAGHGGPQFKTAQTKQQVLDFLCRVLSISPTPQL